MQVYRHQDDQVQSDRSMQLRPRDSNASEVLVSQDIGDKIRVAFLVHS